MSNGVKYLNRVIIICLFLKKDIYKVFGIRGKISIKIQIPYNIMDAMCNQIIDLQLIVIFDCLTF